MDLHDSGEPDGPQTDSQPQERTSSPGAVETPGTLDEPGRPAEPWTLEPTTESAPEPAPGPEAVTVPGWRGAGHTLGRALDTYGSAIGIFLSLGFPGAVLGAIATYASDNRLAFALLLVLLLVTNLVISAAINVATDELWSGRRPSLADSLDRAAGRAVPVFLAGLVVGLAWVGLVVVMAVVGGVLVAVAGPSSPAIAVVLIAFVVVAVVAGVVVALRWSLVSQAIVLDGLGPLAGLARSWTVTRGHVLGLIGLALLVGLVGFLASSGASAASVYATNRWLAAATVGLGSLVTTPVIGIAFAIVYRDLTGRPQVGGDVIRPGRGRTGALATILGTGLIVFAVGAWAYQAGGGLTFQPDRGVVVAGTARNPLDPCRPAGIKTAFDATDDIWIAATFDRRIPAGEQVVVSYSLDGVTLGSAPITADPPGLECYYETASVTGLRQGMYRVTITYGSVVVADGSFTVR